MRPASVACLSACSLALLVAGGATAEPRMTVETHVSIAMRHEQRPTFYASTAPIAVDGGRRLYLGRGIRDEQGTFHLLDLDGFRRSTRSVDIDGYLARHRDTFTESGKWPLGSHAVERLLYFDTDRARAGILVRSFDSGYLWLFVWDLGQDVIASHVLLGEPAPGTVGDVDPLWVRPADGAFFCVVRYMPTDSPFRGKGHAAALVRVAANGKATEVVRLRAEHQFWHPLAFDPALGRFLLPQYDELDGKVTPEVVGHVIDIASGHAAAVPVPVTAYGAVFSADGRDLFVYSNQTGALWKIDVATARKVAETAVGERGFAVGRRASGHVLVLRHEELVEVDAGRMRRRGAFPITRLYRGFSHTEGSFFLGERLILRNGDDLYVVRVGAGR